MIFFKNILTWLLRQEAKSVLQKYKPKVVAITGSVGKTSTKDAIAAVVGARYSMRASLKSYNSEIGLPLTILGVENAWRNPLAWAANLIDGLSLMFTQVKYPEWLVLEVGADRPGDISSLVPWLKTNVVVITRLPEVPVHVEFFSSVEEVVEEKAALIDTLQPGGTLLLYADDPRTAALARRLPAPDATITMFGFGAHAEVRGEQFEMITDSSDKPVGMRGTIVYAGGMVPVEIIGALGAHAFLPAVAAVGVGHALGLTTQEIAEGVAHYQPAPGRMRVLPGLKDTVVIDDTYNSSPAAVEAALETLAEVKMPGRKIAVFADMLELGRTSVAEHRKIGERASKVADLLVTVGFRARDIAEAALDNGLKDEQILQYEDSRKAGEELKNIIQAGDCILVKGSQSMRMERVVEELMLEPQNAPDLLVRQDAEWKKR
ncbi:MAG: Mur ligase family protein [Patescibacteria group bacterium]